MVDFSEIDQTTPLRTRGGLNVIEWWLQEDVPDTFFPIRAIIEMPDGLKAEMPFNRNGRRFINAESEWDLEVTRLRKRAHSTDKLDTMPDVMKAIECVRNKDLDGVRSANKMGGYAHNAEKLRYNYIIGKSDEGLG